MSDVTVAMELAARGLVGQHPEIELDFTRSSLAALEGIIGRTEKRVSEATTRGWGAYLGETIRQARPDAVTWIDRATVAPINTLVAGVEPGYDVDAILRVASVPEAGYWFPLAKVEKFLRNGSTDSLSAFAGVVLASLLRAESDEERERRLAERAPRNAAMIDIGRAFVANPEATHLRELDRFSSSLGTPTQERNVETVRAMGLRAEHFVPLFAIPAVGRGYQRFDAGHVAARWLAAIAIVAPSEAERAMVVDVARRELESKRATVLTNASFALTYADGFAGSHAEALAQHASGDRSRIAGAVRALYHVTSDWRMKDYAPNLTFAPLAALFVDAIGLKSPHLATALDALWTWIWISERSGDIAPVVPALFAVARQCSKPQARRKAADIIDRYLWGMVNGDALRDANHENAAREAGLGERQLARLSGAVGP